MIIDNEPPIERHISVPRDMSQLSCSSFTAGVVEAVLDGLSFVCDAFFKKEKTSRDLSFCSPLESLHTIRQFPNFPTGQLY